MVWLARHSYCCLKLFGTVSLDGGPSRRCAFSSRPSCRPLLVTAPYPPPRVNIAILLGQTFPLEGAQRARIVAADHIDVRFGSFADIPQLSAPRPVWP